MTISKSVLKPTVVAHLLVSGLSEVKDNVTIFQQFQHGVELGYLMAQRSSKSSTVGGYCKQRSLFFFFGVTCL